jgi:GTP-binding protein Era
MAKPPRQESVSAGYATLIGKPNVGKSTLLNRLLGVKLSIVGPKPQLTRNRILGILTEGDCQCYFLDTPGIISPEYELQRYMTDQIKGALADADIIIWMTDPWYEKGEWPGALLKEIGKRPVLGVVNKIDLIAKPNLLPIIEQVKLLGVEEIIPVSALSGSGVEILKASIFERLPEGPFLYPTEDISDRPERFFVAELIREKVFIHFKKEVPYATCVAIDEFRERERGKDYIRATIFVERNSQKAILIGKDGEALKRIGLEARKEIEDFLGRKVYLDLWVKVKENWRKDKKFLKEVGY